jgi:hypothetical protein
VNSGRAIAKDIGRNSGNVESFTERRTANKSEPMVPVAVPPIGGGN